MFSQGELQRQARVALRALGGHQLEPLICMNWRSSGVAMLLATVSDLRPGSSLELNDRIIDRRQVVDREPKIIKYAERESPTRSGLSS